MFNLTDTFMYMICCGIMQCSVWMWYMLWYYARYITLCDFLKKITFHFLTGLKQVTCKAGRELHKRLLPFSGISVVFAAWACYLESQPIICGYQSMLFM